MSQAEGQTQERPKTGSAPLEWMGSQTSLGEARALWRNIKFHHRSSSPQAPQPLSASPSLSSLPQPPCNPAWNPCLLWTWCMNPNPCAGNTVLILETKTLQKLKFSKPGSEHSLPQLNLAFESKRGGQYKVRKAIKSTARTCPHNPVLSQSILMERLASLAAGPWQRG